MTFFRHKLEAIIHTCDNIKLQKLFEEVCCHQLNSMLDFESSFDETVYLHFYEASIILKDSNLITECHYKLQGIVLTDTNKIRYLCCQAAHNIYMAYENNLMNEYIKKSIKYSTDALLLIRHGISPDIDKNMNKTTNNHTHLALCEKVQLLMHCLNHLWNALRLMYRPGLFNHLISPLNNAVETIKVMWDMIILKKNECDSVVIIDLQHVFNVWRMRMASVTHLASLDNSNTREKLTVYPPSLNEVVVSNRNNTDNNKVNLSSLFSHLFLYSVLELPLPLLSTTVSNHKNSMNEIHEAFLFIRQAFLFKNLGTKPVSSDMEHISKVLELLKQGLLHTESTKEITVGNNVKKPNESIYNPAEIITIYRNLIAFTALACAIKGYTNQAKNALTIGFFKTPLSLIFLNLTKSILEFTEHGGLNLFQDSNDFRLHTYIQNKKVKLSSILFDCLVSLQSNFSITNCILETSDKVFTIHCISILIWNLSLPLQQMSLFAKLSHPLSSALVYLESCGTIDCLLTTLIRYTLAKCDFINDYSLNGSDKLLQILKSQCDLSKLVQTKKEPLNSAFDLKRLCLTELCKNINIQKIEMPEMLMTDTKATCLLPTIKNSNKNEQRILVLLFLQEMENNKPSNEYLDQISSKLSTDKLKNIDIKGVKGQKENQGNVKNVQIENIMEDSQVQEFIRRCSWRLNLYLNVLECIDYSLNDFENTIYIEKILDIILGNSINTDTACNEFDILNKIGHEELHIARINILLLKINFNIYKLKSKSGECELIIQRNSLFIPMSLKEFTAHKIIIKSFEHILSTVQELIKPSTQNDSNRWIIYKVIVQFWNLFHPLFETNDYISSLTILEKITNIPILDEIGQPLARNLKIATCKGLIQNYIKNCLGLDDTVITYQRVSSINLCCLKSMIESGEIPIESGAIFKNAYQLCQEIFKESQEHMETVEAIQVWYILNQLTRASTEIPLQEPKYQVTKIIVKLKLGIIPIAEVNQSISYAIEQIQLCPSIELAARLCEVIADYAHTAPYVLSICNSTERIFKEMVISQDSNYQITSECTNSEKLNKLSENTTKLISQHWYWYSVILLYHGSALNHIIANFIKNESPMNCIEIKELIYMASKYFANSASLLLVTSVNPKKHHYSLVLVQLYSLVQNTISQSLLDITNIDFLIEPFNRLLSEELLDILPPLNHTYQPNMHNGLTVDMISTMFHISIDICLHSKLNMQNVAIELLQRAFRRLPSNCHLAFINFEIEINLRISTPIFNIMSKLNQLTPINKARAWYTHAIYCNNKNDKIIYFKYVIQTVMDYPSIKGHYLILFIQWLGEDNVQHPNLNIENVKLMIKSTIYSIFWYNKSTEIKDREDINSVEKIVSSKCTIHYSNSQHTFSIIEYFILFKLYYYLIKLTTEHSSDIAYSTKTGVF